MKPLPQSHLLVSSRPLVTGAQQERLWAACEGPSSWEGLQLGSIATSDPSRAWGSEMGPS